MITVELDPAWAITPGKRACEIEIRGDKQSEFWSGLMDAFRDHGAVGAVCNFAVPNEACRFSGRFTEVSNQKIKGKYVPDKFKCVITRN